MREEIDCGTCVYKCQKCTITFARAKDAIYHEKNCGNCNCQTCDKTFPNQLALRKHLNIHKETYKCEVCQKLFQTRYMLTRHQKVHDKRKDFSCTCCNAKFSIKSNLNRHYKNAHDKQWLAYKCVYVHVVRELIFSFFVMMSQLFQICSADPKRGGWQGESLVPVPTHTVPGATQIEGIGSTNFGGRS